MIPSVVLLVSALLQLSSTHPVLEEMRRQFVNPYEVNSPTSADRRMHDVYRLKASVNNLTAVIGSIEDKMKANPSLPRLTRGELLDLLENVTQSKQIQDTRNRKSVMLVMPFTPDKAEQVKIEDFYTKPPLTTIIGDGEKKKETVVKRIIKRRRRPFDKTTEGYVRSTNEPSSNKTNRIRISSRISGSTKEAPTTTTTATTTTTDPQVITFKSFVEEFTTLEPVKRFPVYQPTTSTEVSIVTKSSQALYNIVKRRRRPTRTPVRETTKGQYPEGPKRVEMNQVLKLLNSPNLSLENIETTTTAKPWPRRTTQPPRIETTTFYQRYPFPVSSARPFELVPSLPQQQSGVNNFFLPDHLKYTLDELGINKIPNTYNSINYEEQQQVPGDVKNILDSFVVYSPSTTHSPNINDVADSLTPEMKELLMSFGLLPSSVQTEPLVEEEQEQIASASAPVINPSSYARFKPLPDSAPITNHMQDFLERFGLGRKGKSAREPKAFSLEKEDANLDDVPFVEVGMLPDSLKGIIGDLGILERNSSETRINSNETSRESKKIRTALLEKILEKPNQESEAEKHVFKPTDVPYAVEELNKLSQLLDIIKQLEKLNKTVTEEDFSQDELKNLTELVGSLNNDSPPAFTSQEDVKNLSEIIGSLNDKKNKPLNEQSWGPDPLNFDIGFEKNEVKRQENSTSASGGVEIVTPSSVAVVTEASSNIKGLEESFGGPIGPSESEVATIPPPTSSPNNGFYYLLDWNSFLEIDDQKGKRVNLRLQPKVGDPKRFYSVAVP